MNRTVLAIVAAAVACGLGYAMTVGTLMLQTMGGVVALAMLFFPGLLWGAVFAVAILVPLWLLTRGYATGMWLVFALPAVVLWAVISTGLFATRGLSAFEAIGNAVMVLPAGIAAALAFMFVAGHKPLA